MTNQDEGPMAAALVDALHDSGYLAGVTAGWNAAQSDDPNGELAKLKASRSGYLAEIKAARYTERVRGVPEAEPMFWVRLRSDGCYDGPLHNDAIETVRTLSGAWSPLYLGAAPCPPTVSDQSAEIERLVTLLRQQTDFLAQESIRANQMQQERDGLREALRLIADYAKKDGDIIAQHLGRIANAALAAHPKAEPQCHCTTCRPITMDDMRFVVCPTCGNKRCPHARNHRNDCTGSNEPGQVGSAEPQEGEAS